MKITVNTFGTRGDIQPYIALSIGLQKAGHSVRIVTHKIFEPFVRKYDLDFYPLHLDPRQVLINQSLSELGNNFIRITRWMERHYKIALEDIFVATLSANRDADLMLNSGLSFAGWHVAEKLQIPALAAYLWPVTPSRYLPAATGKIPPPWLPFKPLVNYWSTKLSNQLFFNLMLPLTNQCRRKVLDLPPMKAREYWTLDSARSPTELIYGFSPKVIPKPSDWCGNQQITGYWFLDMQEEYQPEKDLVEFLEGSPPPVCIGFGSMVDHEQQQISRLVIDALRETGQRGILLGGWSEFGSTELSIHIFRADAVPHDWLFPQMAAVIHHGGAGTTAAAFRSGVPSVVVPWFGDQFFWGWRVEQLGVGTKPIPRSRLTKDGLVESINQVLSDPGVKQRALQLGKELRTEDGVGKAVRLIEAFSSA